MALILEALIKQARPDALRPIAEELKIEDLADLSGLPLRVKADLFRQLTCGTSKVDSSRGNPGKLSGHSPTRRGRP